MAIKEYVALTLAFTFNVTIAFSELTKISCLLSIKNINIPLQFMDIFLNIFQYVFKMIPGVILMLSVVLAEWFVWAGAWLTLPINGGMFSCLRVVE